MYFPYGAGKMMYRPNGKVEKGPANRQICGLKRLDQVTETNDSTICCISIFLNT
jgi:hypothetical protein